MGAHTHWVPTVSTASDPSAQQTQAVLEFILLCCPARAGEGQAVQATVLTPAAPATHLPSALPPANKCANYPRSRAHKSWLDKGL